MPGKIKRMELEDLSGFSDVSVTNEMKEDFYREVASTTVKPILERLREVYLRNGRRYAWNGIVAVGLRIYALARKGFDLDYYGFARSLARRWNIPDTVVREIVDAVLAEISSPARRR